MATATETLLLSTLLTDEISFQLAGVDLMEIITDGFVRPTDAPLERIHDAHVHDRSDIRQVSLRDTEVERTKWFTGHDPCSVLQIGKSFLQMMINLGSESKVVDKNYGRFTNCLPVFYGQEVSLMELVGGILLAVPLHPVLEQPVHLHRPRGGDYGLFHPHT